MGMGAWIACVCATLRSCRGQKRASGPLELEAGMGVLGTEPGSSSRAASAFKCRANSVVHLSNGFG